MAGAGIDFFENGVALAGFAQAFVFEVGGEELFDFFELIGIERGLGGGAGRVLSRVAVSDEPPVPCPAASAAAWRESGRRKFCSRSI